MGLRRAAHVAWRRVGDETVLIHLKTKKIHVLNPSGEFFWHSLDGSRASREIVDGLSLEQPLPGDAAKQLDVFFDQLESADLVEASHASSDTCRPPRRLQSSPHGSLRSSRRTACVGGAHAHKDEASLKLVAGIIASPLTWLWVALLVGSTLRAPIDHRAPDTLSPEADARASFPRARRAPRRFRRPRSRARLARHTRPRWPGNQLRGSCLVCSFFPMAFKGSTAVNP